MSTLVIPSNDLSIFVTLKYPRLYLFIDFRGLLIATGPTNSDLLYCRKKCI